MRALAALAAALAAAMVWSGGAAEADAYTVDPFNRVMEVAEGANVRAGPGPDYAVRVTLNEGVKVRVTGTVRDRDWLRVDLRGDGGAAFVYAPLLKETATVHAPLPKETATVHAPLPKETATVKPFGPGWSITRNQPCQVWNQGRGDEYGPFTWSGACVDGRASGEGRLVWRSRFGRYVYEGGMEAGKLHGKGKLVQSDGGRYEGQWRDGKRHGRGTYKWIIGHRYQGDWRDDRPHGFGIATYADGEVHKGLWLHGCYGKREGQWAALIASVDDCGFD